MINLKWLKNMKKYDEKYGVLSKDIAITDDVRKEYRKMKALEIIAEELIKINSYLTNKE